MSASKNVSRGPASAQDCLGVWCACVCVCLLPTLLPGVGVGLMLQQCVTAGDHGTQTLRLPPQPTSQFSGSQMSPRCFSLPAWLRAVHVCVYFGRPTL